MARHATAISFSMYPDEVEAFDAYARGKGFSRSQAFRHLLGRAGLVDLSARPNKDPKPEQSQHAEGCKCAVCKAGAR